MTSLIILIAPGRGVNTDDISQGPFREAEEEEYESHHQFLGGEKRMGHAGRAGREGCPLPPGAERKKHNCPSEEEASCAKLFVYP